MIKKPLAKIVLTLVREFPYLSNTFCFMGIAMLDIWEAFVVWCYRQQHYSYQVLLPVSNNAGESHSLPNTSTWKLCCVIIVGTNDVADEVTDNIYRRLEEHLVSLLHSANKVLAATLPFRHDLPAQSPTNDKILQVNAHICELCSRYKGADAVDLTK